MSDSTMEAVRVQRELKEFVKLVNQTVQEVAALKKQVAALQKEMRQVQARLK